MDCGVFGRLVSLSALTCMVSFQKNKYSRRKVGILERQQCPKLEYRSSERLFHVVCVSILCCWTLALSSCSLYVSSQLKVISNGSFLDPEEDEVHQLNLPLNASSLHVYSDEERAMDGALLRIEEAKLRHDRELDRQGRTDEVAGGKFIVWLLSFPNSGTSYTSRLVRESTKSMTATNYADEFGDQPVTPVFSNQTSGPFWIPQGNFGPPNSRFVLVKTHCGMRCADCSYLEYAESTYSFRRKCTVTKWIPGHSKRKNDAKYGSYSTDRIRKAVHLVRDPFDNVVSRFHLHMKKMNNPYPSTRQGFLEYCLEQDQKFTDPEIRYAHFKDNPLLRDLWMVPCHAEFCKFIEWHNLAFFLVNDLGLPAIVVPYESYAKGDGAGQSLLNFLELEKVAPFPSFSLKTYGDYFSPEERSIVKRAFQFMASRQTWEWIKRYMPSTTAHV